MSKKTLKSISNYFIKCLRLTVLIFSVILFSSSHALTKDNKPQVVFAGITFAGVSLEKIEAEFPNLTPAWKDIRLSNIVMAQIPHRKFSFDLIQSTGLDRKKEFIEVKNPLSLSILVTRETLFKDVYSLSIQGQMKEFTKCYFSVGLTGIFFTPAGNKDKIEYAIPVIAEDILLGSLTHKQAQNQFLNTFERAVEVLLARLERLNLREVQAKILDVRGNTIKIDAGKRSGVLKGIFVDLPGSGEGQVVEVEKDVSYISCSGGEVNEDDLIKLNICRSEDDETYQVVEVKIESKIAEDLFGRDTNFKTLCAQRFSDYLSDRGGVIVLPSRIGAAYIRDAKVSLLSAYGLEGDHYDFIMPKAKYPILLNIIGLGKGMLAGNDINQVWGYKAVVGLDINGRKKDATEFIKEEVIIGVKGINDYEAYREVILQALAKLAAM
jgi:hypothetical protein